MTAVVWRDFRVSQVSRSPQARGMVVAKHVTDIVCPQPHHKQVVVVSCGAVAEQQGWNGAPGPGQPLDPEACVLCSGPCRVRGACPLLGSPGD